MTAAQISGPELFGTNVARGGDHNQRVTLHAVRVNGPVARTELAAEMRRRVDTIVRERESGAAVIPVVQYAEIASGAVPAEMIAKIKDRGACVIRGTFEQAQWIAKEVDRPNLLVKIPATMAGLPAIEDCIAHGTSINITLIFSLERYEAVVEAYLRGLERLVAGGGDPSKVASVASFFVSRVDTEADKRLEALGNTKLQGKLAIANAKLAYEHYLEAFSGPRWDYLAGKGATKQRCLWASTSTKNPAYRDVMYVEELIGPETVNTMPLETIEAFQDHGEVRGDTVKEGLDEARQLLVDLAVAGVDYDDVTATVESEGVEKFVSSVAEILDGIAAKRTSLAA